MSERKRDLPPTAYAVLSLLLHGGDLSGYEIRQWALRSLRHFYWSPAQSQIYRELTRLGEAGLIESSDVAQDGRPDKTVHSITDEGRDVLAEWVRRDEVERAQFKHPMALRLFAGELGTEATMRRSLESHLDGIDMQLGELEELTIALADSYDARFAREVSKWGFEILSADRSATIRLLDQLGELYTDRAEFEADAD